MKRRFVQPGDVVRIEIAFSEVCMFMHVAGKAMQVRFQSAYAAQLLYDDGREFSAAITPGEAGFYFDPKDGYYCYEVNQ